MIDSNPTLDFELLGQAYISLLNPLMHQPHHLLSAGEPGMSESKVYRVDQAVIEEALRDWKAVMEKCFVGLDKLRLITLVVEALRVVVS
jgi:hypothetical protein